LFNIHPQETDEFFFRHPKVQEAASVASPIKEEMRDGRIEGRGNGEGGSEIGRHGDNLSTENSNFRQLSPLQAF